VAKVRLATSSGDSGDEDEIVIRRSSGMRQSLRRAVRVGGHPPGGIQPATAGVVDGVADGAGGTVPPWAASTASAWSSVDTA